MDFGNYSDLSLKPKKTRTLINDLGLNISLKELVKQDWEFVTKAKVIRAFCNDLTNILDQDNIYKMIGGLFAVENSLAVLGDEELWDEKEELPNLAEFYSALSPVLLRALWENQNNDLENSHVVESWIEALRISIEEELYIWKEKLVEY
jgi:hypothetical protein